MCIFLFQAISAEPIRKPENYSVEIRFINPPHNDGIECSTAISNEENEMLTSLILNCSQDLETELLGLLTVTASNRAGSIKLLREEEISELVID